MLKTAVQHNTFCGISDTFLRIFRWIESCIERIGRRAAFFIIINVFAVSFDQLNVSLLIKSINFYKENLTDLNFTLYCGIQ